MKKVLTILLGVLCVMSISAKSVVIDGLHYTVKGRAVSVRVEKKGDNSIVTLNIPKNVAVDGKYYPVTELEAYGFANLPNLQAVVVPSTVNRIGSGAFADCSNLRAIVMPDAAKVNTSSFYAMEGDAVFAGCVSLASISGHNGTVPDYVTKDCLKGCIEVPFVGYKDKPKSEYDHDAAALLANLLKSESAPAPAPTEEPTSIELPTVALPDVVDTDIPATGLKSPNVFAVIIGNENYTRGVANVDYAANDARMFANYCTKTLGLPEKNVRTYFDATYGDMLEAIDDITAIADAYKGKAQVIFYYAGHGMPDNASREAYLLPCDASGSNLAACYPLSMLYRQLGELNVKQTVVLLDACFSGSTRGNDMLSSVRGVKIMPKEARPQGSTVVLSASTGSQTAFPYRDKNHGLFTYYLLEKLRETRGNVTLGELFEHINDNVSRQSVVEERKAQVPTITVADNLESNWSKLTLR